MERILAVLGGKLGAMRETFDATDPMARRLLRAFTDRESNGLAQFGISTELLWIENVIPVLASGSQTMTIDTVGPYALHHVNSEGELHVRRSSLPADEQAGLLLGRLLRETIGDLPNTRMVALIDDLTTHDPERSFTAEEQDRYFVAMEELFREAGIIGDSDEQGRDYVLHRESDQVDRVPELIERLGRSTAGWTDATGDGDVVFHPTDQFIEALAIKSGNRQREFRRRGIAVSRSGRPTCQALNAAMFLGAHDGRSVHVVVLDRSFQSQQDKTYALLRALGLVTQNTYHNAYFDATVLSPALIAYAIGTQLEHQLECWVARTHESKRYIDCDSNEGVHNV